MSTPERPQVAWKAIEADAKIVTAEGEEIGTISEVVGDPDADIFTGLSIDTDLFGPDRFVPAERVQAIWPDRVQVAVPASAAGDLPEYEEAPVEDWRPDGGGVGSFFGRLARPGDGLEIGRSLTRAFAWALVWGLAATIATALLPGIGLGAAIVFGLLALVLVLVSPRLWRWPGDAIVGALGGLAAAVVLLLSDHSLSRALGIGVLILAAALAMGALMRALAARRTRT